MVAVNTLKLNLSEGKYLYCKILQPDIKSLIRGGIPHEFRSKVWSR